MNSFDDFLKAHGYEPKLDIAHGKWIRFGKKDSVSAKLYDDGLGGYVQDWRTGERLYWFADKELLSVADKRKREAEIKARRTAQEALQEKRYADVSVKAEKLFKDALQASETHPYLVRKRVKPHGIKQVGMNLLIPVYSVLGDFQSIQYINEHGDKRFMSGGKTSGGCHFIGEIKSHKPIYISEGYATACSIYEDIKTLTIVAFNAGNLIKVATDLRKQLPEVPIVIAGDCDAVGKKYAEQAAHAVNGKILIPDFGENKEGLSDWNDYMNQGVNR
jgi:putative DNA primase/helicase